jgi:negative regulator of flagellin synthesis FlgM
MMIDRLGGINPLNPVSEPTKAHKVLPARNAGDLISVSDESRAQADAYYLAQVAAETPDVRMSLIEAVREKIKNPAYITGAVIDSVAKNMLASWEI